jgi:hypothetical protein
VQSAVGGTSGTSGSITITSCVAPTPSVSPTGTPSLTPTASATRSPCPAGTFSTEPGSCQRCPGGHFCPAGASSRVRLNCGRGNYCPEGAGAPAPCPIQVPPSGGWPQRAQGPAFLVDTARCLNHCFWNFTSDDGILSKC